MSAVFLKILNMSITASWLILAVVLVRLLLKKAPKWIPCLLWGLVAIRLVCPFSFGSIFSLIPSSETIPTNITVQQEPAINSGITAVNEFINPVIAESFTPAPTDSVNPLQIIIPIAAIIWIAGIVIMLAYALISYIKLKKTVSVCVPVGERILSCDEVKAPFILGVLRPVIYVPSSMTGETLDLVIRHETAHLQRHDHWWKPLGYLLLAIYWFNPLCWIAYILLSRDIEMACDEKVIRDMDKDEMAAYSQALLDCSFPRRRIAACPLAFGEVGVKERVKGVLNYKKPAFWIILIAIIACIVLAVCLMTDPKNSFMINRSEVETVSYFNTFIGDDCQGELNAAQIDEMVDRFSAVSKVKRSSQYEGMTPGYQLCVLLKDGSYLYANGYHATDDMVEIISKGKRYSVLDPEFAKYLRNVCSRVDVSPAQGDNINDPPFGRYYTVQEVRYEVKRDGGNTSIPLPEYGLSIDKNLLILEDLNSNNWLNAGTFTEVVLSKDTFDQYFDPDGKTLAANMRRNNAKAWQVIVSDLPDSLFYYLLLQKDGEVYLTRGYYDASEKDDPYSDDTRIGYVFLLKENDTHSEEPTLYDLRPMVMVDGVIFMDTGKELAVEIDPSAILGEITSSVTGDKRPTEDGQSNFECIGSQYAYYEDGLVVLINHEWYLFERDGSSNSTDGGVTDPGSITIDIRTDVCELYLEVLEDLWNVDSGLNHGISQIGIDLSELSHLTELEKETVMHEFASKHNLPFIAGTWEELCEQGYIDKDNLYWEDGLFFSIKTNEDGDSDPEHTAFDAQKWRSGLGAYFFGQCTAQKNADGKWSYTVGQEAIS